MAPSTVRAVRAKDRNGIGWATDHEVQQLAAEGTYAFVRLICEAQSDGEFQLRNQFSGVLPAGGFATFMLRQGFLINSRTREVVTTTPGFARELGQLLAIPVSEAMHPRDTELRLCLKSFAEPLLNLARTAKLPADLIRRFENATSQPGGNVRI